jgi:hypothetical protein
VVRTVFSTITTDGQTVHLEGAFEVLSMTLALSLSEGEATVDGADGPGVDSEIAATRL